MLLLLPERRPLGLKLGAEMAAEPNKNRRFSGGSDPLRLRLKEEWHI